MQSSSRQHVRAAIEEITAADLANGVVTNLLSKFTNGCVILGLTTLVVEAFNPGTSMVVDLGVAGDASIANDVNFAAAVGTRVQSTTLPSVFDTSTGGTQLTAVATIVGAAPTLGKVLVMVTYLEEGVELFSQS